MSFSFLALLDDVASVLDDVAVLSKTATQKTLGVVGDDIALNADQLVGPSPEREIPVVVKVTIGSLKNKVILVPVALALSYFLPWLIMPLLMIGGSFLCYEGIEKIVSFVKRKENINIPVEVITEDEKIKNAIKTDLVLSTEIIVIALGVVSGKPFIQQVISLSIVAIILTFGVYGLVALIIKFDDFGLYLTKKEITKKIGFTILRVAPYLLKCVGFVGTWAMLLVGGGILAHILHLQFNSVFSIFIETALGSLIGILLFIVVKIFLKIRKRI